MQKDIIEYLTDCLKSFEIDPADTTYQEGYKAALEDALFYFNGEKK